VNETEFQNIAEETIEAIQNAIEESGVDIDYDEVDGVLELEFDNDSKIIFSKQEPLKQLWVAAVSGGFHFNFDAKRGTWICDSGDREELYAMLSRLATEQGDVEVEFSA
jgi:CyaY protein